jgi:Rrf2 family protein
MIKLSTKGRYGARLMLNLAHHYNDDNKPLVLKNVSDEEGISIRYLEQIVIPLKVNRLVKSIRGAGGGYTLSRHPSKISINEIIEALEGPICLVDCIDDSNYCYRIPTCATYECWREGSFLLRDYFTKMTLQNLIEISAKKKSKHRKKKAAKSKKNSYLL